MTVTYFYKYNREIIREKYLEVCLKWTQFSLYPCNLLCRVRKCNTIVRACSINWQLGPTSWYIRLWCTGLRLCLSAYATQKHIVRTKDRYIIKMNTCRGAFLFCPTLSKYQLIWCWYYHILLSFSFGDLMPLFSIILGLFFCVTLIT